MIRKLKAHPYANAFVEIDTDGNKYLWSYRTLVCELRTDGWFKCYGLYSMTTRKHISAFMKEYGGGVLKYDNAKSAYEGNYRINIYTGEIEELA
jgi:hypothetical protein